MQTEFLTLDEFTIQQLRLFPGGTGELSRLLRDIGLAAKRINVEVNKAGLQDILGDMGFSNVQGEESKEAGCVCQQSIDICVEKRDELCRCL